MEKCGSCEQMKKENTTSRKALMETNKNYVEIVNENLSLRRKLEEAQVNHTLMYLPLGENDADAATVGEYLGLLLSTLWLQQEGFSSKRPFGNGDWTTPIYLAMGKAGLITIILDENGYLEDFDVDEETRADEMILQAIRYSYYGR